MKKQMFSIFFLSILGTMACQKERINILEESSDNYLVFGQVGLGWGCRVSALYKIADGKLYADTSKVFCKNQENYQFSGYQLPDNEYNKVKNLITQFPTELSKEGSKTFGCPGCADGGMLFIQRKEKGKELQSWRIDDNIFFSKNSVTNEPFPDYLYNYVKDFGKLFNDLKYK